MSRNGVFLTGNGTNDDHYGQNWHGITNNWFTSVWAASTAEADLLAALAAGPGVVRFAVLLPRRPGPARPLPRAG
jgi:hypothetical protein